jgi:hypothetical protein
MSDIISVPIELQVVRGGNAHTKTTERFLLNQPDVLDASVWMSEGYMMAHVTLSDGSKWTERALRLQCALALGLAATPREVIMRSARQRAA